jgi:hypothetical protein
VSQPRGKRTSGTGRQDAALLTPYLVGPDGQLFGDPMPALDETSFQVDNTSEAYYNSPYYTQHENDILAIPVPAPTAPLELESVIGADFLAPIVNGNKISFHVVGDTGASESSAITTEASVADAMAAALVAAPPADAPAFFFHLGDVIYNFGEAQYYYDQFYEPFRAYDRPIFAIPGNHDGEVTYINGGSTPDVPTLQAFIANFCTPAPARPASAGGLVRTTMTQPGVYFTLDAPFVSIIGLYTNVLEGPGVLTDQGGMYPTLTGDAQYGWLVSELERLKPQRTALDRAVILACHHPPASADERHGTRRRSISSGSRRRGGIPLGAEQRLKADRRRESPFHSDLSAKEYALAQASGLTAARAGDGLLGRPARLAELRLVLASAAGSARCRRSRAVEPLARALVRPPAPGGAVRRRRCGDRDRDDRQGVPR